MPNLSASRLFSRELQLQLQRVRAAEGRRASSVRKQTNCGRTGNGLAWSHGACECAKGSLDRSTIGLRGLAGGQLPQKKVSLLLSLSLPVSTFTEDCQCHARPGAVATVLARYEAASAPGTYLDPTRSHDPVVRTGCPFTKGGHGRMP